MDFKHIYAEEPLFQGDPEDPDSRAGKAIGLAFSGGGIRSATFNLGILQGMARRGLLKHVDYLSTVSGGGYIGGWYMAFLKRQADNKPERAEALLDPECPCPSGAPAEHPSVTWLRRFSNYLTPRTGLSGDSLTLVSTYLRNLLLNLIVIVTFLGALLLVPRALGWGVPYLWSLASLPWLAAIPLVFAVLALPFLLLSMHRAEGPGAPWWKRQLGVLLLVVLPAMAAAFFLALGLASPGYGPWAAWASQHLTARLLFLDAVGLDDSLLVTQFIAMASYLTPWLAVGLIMLATQRTIHLATTSVLTLSALGASIPAGLMFFGLAHLSQALNPTPFELVTFGPPLVMVAFMFPVALHIGLARRRFSDMQREWWARLGGWLMTLAAAWVLLFGIALFGPPILGSLNDWVAASGGAAWVASTLWGVLAGKAADTGTTGKGPRETLLGLVPWVFLLGLLLLLSLALHKGLETQAEPQGPSPAASLAATSETALPQQAKSHPPTATSDSWRRSAAADHGTVSLPDVARAEAVLLALFLLFGWRIDINLFSLHNFYRNRLARCYLGASRHCTDETRDQDCRKPNPFTGFDPDDDLAVSELGPRPYPLFNTALNLVGGEELAWQQRKAAAFCITPGCSGYQFPPGMADRDDTPTFGPTDTFLCGEFPGGGGVRAGTAMAISGAAVNPNMGFHSSPAVSFLLTVFNVRLGRWVGNPAKTGAWPETSPRFGVRYLFFELFGMTSARRSWFNLSDGGHFENLGIYELVRRQLPYIIASDAAEDAEYHFDDLANAIRKIRADFGIDIEIDVSGLRPAEPGGRQRAHAAVGSIRYDRLNPRLRPGVLVYIRPGLTGNEPADVLSYARRNPPFPFQSTADQFFDESQFESYRQLGLHVAKGVFEEAAERRPTATGQFNAEAFFTVLKEAWRGRLELDKDQASAHHLRLDDLFERLRKDPDLAFLSAEIFPEWPDLMGKPVEAMELPAYEEQKRSGFYVCREIAQLMERVYQDLNLEDQYDHPDSRGWMNLFRHWSWSPMFRATYAITAATLSERFQRFCKRRLELDLGDMEVGLAALDDASLESLNFVERELVDSMVPAARRAKAAGAYRLARFEMVIRYPSGQPGGQPVELLRFHFGFALLAGHRLAFFRIQDHLRRMGLARRALSLLCAREPRLTMDTESAEPTLKAAADALAVQPPVVEVIGEERQALWHLFKSVKTIRSQPARE